MSCAFYNNNKKLKGKNKLTLDIEKDEWFQSSKAYCHPSFIRFPRTLNERKSTSLWMSAYLIIKKHDYKF